MTDPDYGKICNVSSSRGGKAGRAAVLLEMLPDIFGVALVFRFIVVPEGGEWGGAADHLVDREESL